MHYATTTTFVSVKILSPIKFLIMNKLFLIPFVLIGFAVNSFAQSSAEATATATVIQAIAITNVNDMNFGNVAVSGVTAGAVVLDPQDGSRTATGGVTLPAVQGTVSAASFTVTGEGSSTYAITLPSGNHEITNSGTGTMNVNNFTSFPSVVDGGTLTAGEQTLNVGATLDIIAGQEPGVYTNATGFEVTVNYN